MWNSTVAPGVNSSVPTKSSRLTKSPPLCFPAFSCWISSAGWIQPYLPFQAVTEPTNFSAEMRVRGKRCPLPLLRFLLMALPLPNLPTSNLPLPPSNLPLVATGGAQPLPPQDAAQPLLPQGLPQAPLDMPLPESLPLPLAPLAPLAAAALPFAAAASAAPGGTTPVCTTSSAPRPESSSQMWNSTGAPTSRDCASPSMSFIPTKMPPLCSFAFSCSMSSPGWIHPYLPFHAITVPENFSADKRVRGNVWPMPPSLEPLLLPLPLSS
mmetsp:Transcript_80304/g.203073  ORF Transcript_80304/g.203073 Transcript_80304/m.203073 type:complete len:267 (+) Transcript_80304:155-955(+)